MPKKVLTAPEFPLCPAAPQWLPGQPADAGSRTFRSSPVRRRNFQSLRLSHAPCGQPRKPEIGLSIGFDSVLSPWPGARWGLLPDAPASHASTLRDLVRSGVTQGGVALGDEAASIGAASQLVPRRVVQVGRAAVDVAVDRESAVELVLPWRTIDLSVTAVPWSIWIPRCLAGGRGIRASTVAAGRQRGIP